MDNNKIILGDYMIITDKCFIKSKLQMLIELVRIHERFCTLLEEEWDYEDAYYEAEEVLTCMGFKFEFKPNDKVRADDILVGEILSIIDYLYKEIKSNDWLIHYNKKYYDPVFWDIEGLEGDY